MKIKNKKKSDLENLKKNQERKRSDGSERQTNNEGKIDFIKHKKNPESIMTVSQRAGLIKKSFNQNTIST